MPSSGGSSRVRRASRSAARSAAAPHVRATGQPSTTRRSARGARVLSPQAISYPIVSATRACSSITSRRRRASRVSRLDRARESRPRSRPSRRYRRRVGARPRRGPRCPSCRDGSRPRNRPGRARSRSALRRRTGGRTRCSPRARAASTAGTSDSQRSAGRSPQPRRPFPERRDPVQGDPTARGVETRRGRASAAALFAACRVRCAYGVRRLEEALEL